MCALRRSPTPRPTWPAQCVPAGLLRPRLLRLLLPSQPVCRKRRLIASRPLARRSRRFGGFGGLFFLEFFLRNIYMFALSPAIVLFHSHSHSLSLSRARALALLFYLCSLVFLSLSLFVYVSLSIGICIFFIRFFLFFLLCRLFLPRRHRRQQSRKAKSKAAPAPELATAALLAQYACLGAHSVASSKAKASASAGMYLRCIWVSRKEEGSFAMHHSFLSAHKIRVESISDIFYKNNVGKHLVSHRLFSFLCAALFVSLDIFSETRARSPPFSLCSRSRSDVRGRARRPGYAGRWRGGRRSDAAQSRLGQGHSAHRGVCVWLVWVGQRWRESEAQSSVLQQLPIHANPDSCFQHSPQHKLLVSRLSVMLFACVSKAKCDHIGLVSPSNFVTPIFLLSASDHRGSLLQGAHKAAVTSVAFHATEAALFTTSADHTAICWRQQAYVFCIDMFRCCGELARPLSLSFFVFFCTSKLPVSYQCHFCGIIAVVA